MYILHQIVDYVKSKRTLLNLEAALLDYILEVAAMKLFD